MRFARPSILGLVLALVAAPALAQSGDDGTLQDIDVSSNRVRNSGGGAPTGGGGGGSIPGIDEDALTEETLPAKGDKRRLPALHKIAARYVRGTMWRDACDRYDQILDEFGPEGLESDAAAKPLAGQAYLKCGEIESRGGSAEKADLLLKKSERYVKSDYRHASIRRVMKRDGYRLEMSKGNVEKALKLFREYQGEKPDEDERIWMGDQLAEIALAAWKSKDKVALERAMRDCEAVAPMNTEYRKLKDRLEETDAVWSNVLRITAIAVVLLVVLQQFFAWRARAKVAALGGPALATGGKKNKFLDD